MSWCFMGWPVACGSVRQLQTWPSSLHELPNKAKCLAQVQRYLATLGVQRSCQRGQSSRELFPERRRQTRDATQSRLDRARVWREEEPNDRRRWRWFSAVSQACCWAALGPLLRLRLSASPCRGVLRLSASLVSQGGLRLSARQSAGRRRSRTRP